MQAFDPFAVLGLARRYNIDLAELERSYLQRSAAMHPDMVGEHGWADLGGEGGDGAIEELNQARQVLADSEQRAIALWKLWGGGGADDKSLPPGLLVEMMEVREEMEAAKSSGDAAAMRKWEEWAEHRRGEYQKRVGELFAGLSPGDSSSAPVLRQIKIELNGWRYIERLVEQLE